MKAQCRDGVALFFVLKGYRIRIHYDTFVGLPVGSSYLYIAECFYNNEHSIYKLFNNKNLIKL